MRRVHQRYREFFMPNRIRKTSSYLSYGCGKAKDVWLNSLGNFLYERMEEMEEMEEMEVIQQTES